jgi:hypothetical protein
VVWNRGKRDRCRYEKGTYHVAQKSMSVYSLEWRRSSSWEELLIDVYFAMVAGVDGRMYVKLWSTAIHGWSPALLTCKRGPGYREEGYTWELQPQL